MIIAFFAGCTASNTPTPQARRITEYQADYEHMSPATQEGVARGFISRADDFKAAYIALGKPDQITASADGRVTTWIYHNFLPPQNDSTRNQAPKQARSYNQINNPLNDTFEAWRHNVSKYERETSGDPNLAPKATNQSWGDYAKYVQERTYSPARKFLDDEQRQKYQDSLQESPLPDPVTIRLDVIFIDQHVSDAIINESHSAFTPTP